LTPRPSEGFLLPPPHSRRPYPSAAESSLGHFCQAGPGHFSRASKVLLIERGRSEDLVEARVHIERSAKMAQSMRIPFPDWLVEWLASSAGRR
jgi:hypothetical protein